MFQLDFENYVSTVNKTGAENLHISASYFDPYLQLLSYFRGIIAISSAIKTYELLLLNPALQAPQELALNTLLAQTKQKLISSCKILMDLEYIKRAPVIIKMVSDRLPAMPEGEQAIAKLVNGIFSMLSAGQIPSADIASGVIQRMINPKLDADITDNKFIHISDPRTYHKTITSFKTKSELPELQTLVNDPSLRFSLNDLVQLPDDQIHYFTTHPAARIYMLAAFPLKKIITLEGKTEVEGRDWDKLLQLAYSAHESLDKTLFTKLITIAITPALYPHMASIINIAIVIGGKAPKTLTAYLTLLENDLPWPEKTKQFSDLFVRAQQEKYKPIPLEEVLPTYQADSESVRPGFKVASEKLDKAATIYQKVEKIGLELLSMDEAAILAKLHEAATAQKNPGTKSAENEAMAWAALREIYRRTYGIQPYSTQIMDAYLIVNEPSKRCIAQVKTGEGKSTLMAMMMAYKALTSDKVQCNVTTTEHLAERDVEKFAKFYKKLGLNCGSISSSDPAKTNLWEYSLTYRNKQILYGVASDYQFGYMSSLDKSSRLKKYYQLGNMDVFIDEVDGLVIDRETSESRIQSKVSEKLVRAGIYEAMLDFITEHHESGLNYDDFTKHLTDNEHFTDEEMKDPYVEKKLGYWFDSCVRVAERVRGRDYILQDKIGSPFQPALPGEQEVVIVDKDGTGALQTGMRWFQGVHELIEHREKRNGEVIRPDKEKLLEAAISQHQFFNMFASIAAVTGTTGGNESEAMLRAMYQDIAIYDFPRYRPSKATLIPPRVTVDQASQFQALVHEMREMAAAGRPMLILFDTIEKTNLFKAFAAAHSHDVTLLNGEQPNIEELLANAGLPGSVLVATSLAGRGADITPTPEAEDAGGLRVLVCTPPDNKRVQWQNFGRTGRQGRSGDFGYLLNEQELALKATKAMGTAQYYANILAKDARVEPVCLDESTEAEFITPPPLAETPEAQTAGAGAGAGAAAGAGGEAPNNSTVTNHDEISLGFIAKEDKRAKATTERYKSSGHSIYAAWLKARQLKQQMLVHDMIKNAKFSDLIGDFMHFCFEVEAIFPEFKRHHVAWFTLLDADKRTHARKPGGFEQLQQQVGEAILSCAQDCAKDVKGIHDIDLNPLAIIAPHLDKYPSLQAAMAIHQPEAPSIGLKLLNIANDPKIALSLAELASFNSINLDYICNHPAAKIYLMAGFSREQIEALRALPEPEAINWDKRYQLAVSAYESLGKDLYAKLIELAIRPDLVEHMATIINSAVVIGGKAETTLAAYFELIENDSPWEEKTKQFSDLFVRAQQEKYTPIPLDEILASYSKESEAVRGKFAIIPAKLDKAASLYQQVERIGNEFLSMDQAAVLEKLHEAVAAQKDPSTQSEENEAIIWAALREVYRRTYGIQPYSTQIMDAYLIVNEPSQRCMGQIKTGEGKSTIMTLMMTYKALLTDKPQCNVTTTVHLAERDVEKFAKFYEIFGLNCGAISSSSPEKTGLWRDPESYKAKQILYGVATDYQFAYMTSLRKDSSLKPYFNLKEMGVFIDEVDGLIIDREKSESRIQSLAPERLVRKGLYDAMLDYTDTNHATGLNYSAFQAHLFGAGIFTADELQQAQVQKKLGYWFDSCQRLTQKVKGRDYIIADKTGIEIGKCEIVIVDKNGSGALMHGMRWFQGLHELVERREIRNGENIRPRSESLLEAAISQHQFFNLFGSIAAVTGTTGGQESETMLQAMYPGMAMYDFPRYRPSNASLMTARVTPNQATQFQALLTEIRAMEAAGRPLLVLFDTIEKTREFQAYAAANSYRDVALLNGEQSNIEELLANAGVPGSVLVATSLAGRGADITPTPEAEAAGGLRVLVCSPPDNKRVQWQNFGRTGRQGRSGDFGFLLNEEELALKAHEAGISTQHYARTLGVDPTAMPIDLDESTEAIIFDAEAIGDAHYQGTGAGAGASAASHQTTPPTRKHDDMASHYVQTENKRARTIAQSMKADEKSIYATWLQNRQAKQQLLVQDMIKNAKFSDLLGDFMHFSYEVGHTHPSFLEHYSSWFSMLDADKRALVGDSDGFEKLQLQVGKAICSIANKTTASMGAETNPINIIRPHLDKYPSIKTAVTKVLIPDREAASASALVMAGTDKCDDREMAPEK